MKQKYFIDSHKGITFLAILLMMAWFKQWQNPTAWIYLALHGTYGILWVLESLTSRLAGRRMQVKPEDSACRKLVTPLLKNQASISFRNA